MSYQMKRFVVKLLAWESGLLGSFLPKELLGSAEDSLCDLGHVTSSFSCSVSPSVKCGQEYFSVSQQWCEAKVIHVYELARCCGADGTYKYLNRMENLVGFYHLSP